MSKICLVFNCMLETAKMSMYLTFKAQDEKKGPWVPGCPQGLAAHPGEGGWLGVGDPDQRPVPPPGPTAAWEEASSGAGTLLPLPRAGQVLLSPASPCHLAPPPIRTESRVQYNLACVPVQAYFCWHFDTRKQLGIIFPLYFYCGDIHIT